MSASSLVVKAKEFAPSRVTYDEPQTNKRGGKSVNIRLNGQPVVLQVPLMLTWGVNEWVDEQTGTVKYDMSLQFDPAKSSSQSAFLSAMKEFQDKVANDAVTNARKWFGKKMSREVVDALMYPMLKYPKNKETGEPDMDRNPTLKLKVPFWEGRFNTEIYDMASQPLYLPPKYGKGAEGNQARGQDATSSPVDFVTKGSHVRGLIRCNGMWFAGGKCGVTWQLVQIQVRPPTRLVGSGQCHVMDDSDDEDMAAELDQKDAEESEEVVQDTGPTFADDDDDEEDEPVVEEETQPEPEPKPKKKKKIVRRKKKSDA